ncbi:ABC transporter permease [Olivibacter domesticus]|uniref:MacB-like core domain-containing protein n=1 Tax=Olivibacter domesticus TaxID=407022 RepID=A0A1H7LUE7_OLID1|nr:ABC transporter permease [Olivibacter domesticus]SEL02560.1 MacB-like core domain-containing protein [Olivibacter domesticus]
MIRNYLKIAWRNIVGHKAHSLINVFGLALGITCYLLISFWVRDETSKDNFHQNGDLLFTTYYSTIADGKAEGMYASPRKYDDNQVSMILKDAKEAIPDIKHLCFYITGYELPWGHPETFQVGDKKVKMEGSRASGDFFKMFNYPLIEGSAETALQDMSGIAISRKMAEIFFGSPKEAMGKNLRFENKRDFIVKAVFENLTTNSSLRFDFLLNWDAQEKLLEWASGNVYTYLQLNENASPIKVQRQLNQFLEARLDKKVGVKFNVGLQRFGDQYLYNHFVNGEPQGGRIEYVRIFNGVAIFILLIACINFMNLATARSIKRAKEVGLRKVVGSNRTHLVIQFFSESILFCLLASLLSLLFLLLAMPAFNYLTEKQMSYPFAQLSFWLNLFKLTLVTGFIAGIYPALYLSSLKPVQILKGILKSQKGAVLFRKGTTIFQFVLSSMLIIATIVISRQMNFIQHTNLGYDRENLVCIRIEGELATYNKYRLFKERVTNMSGIEMVDRTSEAPHEMGFEVIEPINWQGRPANATVAFKPASVGFDFTKLMKLEIVEGRDFSKEISTDSADAFLINEEAAKQMGLKDPIGKWVSAWNKKGHIIGVLKDFHTASLRDPIKPVIIDVKEYEYFGFIMVRTKAGQTRNALASLEKVYSDMNPNYPFSYQFIDKEYENLYKSELSTSKLTIVFSSLAIIISCLGLLGLVMFAVDQRVKEIGVRKVLGASASGIVQLLSKDFIKLVCIALLVALPIAYLLMSKWLNNFAYSIKIQWWMFALAACSMILVALGTIALQAIKAAIANPVNSLRDE